MSGMHFERMAAEYAGARPPYPRDLFDTLEAAGVIGAGVRVLEIGAGAGLATMEMVRRGTEITALEPGTDLVALLHAVVPGVKVIHAHLEDAQLPEREFDSVVAATSMHWVDLPTGLPRINRALRPRGQLAVWRTIFGDDRVQTRFRDEVARIVADREREDSLGRESRPTIAELTAGGWFAPVRTERWRWSADLNADQVRRLFTTFSNWTPAEADRAARAVDDLGGTVTEHYQSVLHLLRRRPDPQSVEV